MKIKLPLEPKLKNKTFLSLKHENISFKPIHFIVIVIALFALQNQTQAIVYKDVTNCVQCLYNNSALNSLAPIPGIRWCNASTPERSTCSTTECPKGNVTIYNVMRCPYYLEDVDINDNITKYPVIKIHTYNPYDQMRIYRVNNTMIKGEYGSYWINDNYNNMSFFLTKRDPKYATYQDL